MLVPRKKLEKFLERHNYPKPKSFVRWLKLPDLPGFPEPTSQFHKVLSVDELPAAP
jgi:hypothetical protein